MFTASSIQRRTLWQPGMNTLATSMLPKRGVSVHSAATGHSSMGVAVVMGVAEAGCCMGLWTWSKTALRSG
eukprot:8208119-Alexandrium_andersonii.AAC.1